MDPVLLVKVRELADAKNQLEKLKDKIAQAKVQFDSHLSDFMILTSNEYAERALNHLMIIGINEEKEYMLQDHYQDLYDELLTAMTP